MSERTPTGKIITFYSYKGGTGRSMALANIAWILASARQRVLVLDWDLEAPGLHRYFRPFLIDKELTSTPGIIDYIIDFCDEAIKPLAEGETLPNDWYVAHADISRYRISVDYEYFPEGGKIDFVPAGQQGSTYATRVNAFNWQDFYQRLGGGGFLDATRDRMREKYDYILIDSRTGVSDTAGICTVQMPDTLAVFFTFNNQSVEGAAAVAQSVYDQRGKERQRGQHKFQILAVPTRVDQTEQKKLKQRKIYSHWRFNPFMDQIPFAERKSYWGGVEVPYVPYFAYEEVLAPFSDEDDEDPKTVLASMKRIADFLVRPEIPLLEIATLISPQDQQRILQEFAATPAGASEDGPSPSGAVEDQVAAPVESTLEKQLRLADSTLVGLDEQETDEARRLWTRLVRVPGLGEKAEVSKVRVNLSDISPNAHPLVEKLAGLDVLTFGKDDSTGQETIEVANEELLRSWPTLQKWIEQDRWLFLWRQSLQRDKAEWEGSGKQRRRLLRGSDLSQARRWYKSHRKYLSDGEATFIEASWRQRLMVALVAAVIVMLMPVSFYLYKYFNKRFVGERLAAAAQQSIDASSGGHEGDQFQLGILLATEAQRYAPTAKAEDILKKYLGQLPRNRAIIDVGGNVLGLAINPEATRILSVTGRGPSNVTSLEDRAAQVHDVQRGKIVIRTPFKPGSRNFQLSPDGRYVAVLLNQNGTYLVEITEAVTGAVVATIKHRLPVYDMTFSPDGLYFATASGDHTAQVVALGAAAAGGAPPPLRYNSEVYAVSFSGNSRYLAIAGEDFKVHVWEITPGQSSWPAPKDIPIGSTSFGIALNETGNYLATISFDNQSVFVWDVASGKKINTFEFGSRGVSSVIFTQDDRFLVVAAGGAGSHVSVCELKVDGGNPAELRVNRDVNLISFSSPDGKFLAVATSSGSAQVWRYNGASFQEEATLFQQFNFSNLTFGSGNLLLTAGVDNTVRILEMGVAPTGDLTNEACARLTRNLTIEEWNTHLASYVGAYRRTCTNIP
jgi:WD40 repeat protein/cellulose biosynthesis protein BcsQ